MEWKRQRMHDESHNLSTNRKDFRNYVENVKSTHLTRFPQNSPPYPRAHSRYVEMSTIVYYNQYMEIARLIHVNFICVWFAFDLCRSCCFLLHFILRRFLTPRLVNGLRILSRFFNMFLLFLQIVVVVGRRRVQRVLCDTASYNLPIFASDCCYLVCLA